MSKHNELGIEGEQLAATYLSEHGYVLIERNWRIGHLEIDIIAEKDDTIVFVEVKTRTSDEYGDPEDAVDDKKIIRLVNAADAYIRIKDVDLAVRFDIVTVITDGAETKIEHLEDAFYPPLSR